MKTQASLVIAVLLGLSWPGSVGADARSAAALEAAEAVVARFGVQVARGGVDALAARIEGFAARYGADAITAVRKVGPQAFAIVEAAGVNGGRATRLMAVYGEAGVSAVLSRPQAMTQFLRLGEDGAAVMVKHPGVAEKVLAEGGETAVRAMAAVGPQNGRRVAMLLEGELAQTGKSQEVLGVIARYGDGAASFLWENKEALAVGATLTAFLANPEPYLNGTIALARVAGEHVVAPVVGGVFSTFHLVLGLVGALLALLLVVAGVLMWKYGVPRAETIQAVRKSLRKK